MKSINNPLFSLYLHTNSQQHWRHRSNIIEWSTEIKHNAQSTRSERWRQKRRTNGIHQRFSLFHFFSHQQTTRLETLEQHHWVNHWNQTQNSLNLIWRVKTKERRHTNGIHKQITLFSLSSHQQITALKTWEQHHWVNHWNQTQHLLNSIWMVTAKERHTMVSIQSQFSFLFLSTGNRIKHDGEAALKKALEVNTTLTELNLSWKQSEMIACYGIIGRSQWVNSFLKTPQHDREESGDRWL